MTKVFALLVACLAVTAPLSAEMLDGADDPAFQAALTRLLAADDPAAVAVLRDLAEAGNAAALVTLPFALQWVPPKGTLKEKNAQRQVGGLNAEEAAAKAHPATAAWNMNRFENAMDLPVRAASLSALGEPEKAASLLYSWLNQTGGYGDFLPEILSDDLPAMLGAYALADRLRSAVRDNGSPKEEAARLLSQMREDRLAAWVAYVHLLETDPEIFDIIGSPLAGTGLSATATEARIADARAVRAVWFGFASDDTPTPVATAARAHFVLRTRTEFLPVARLCEAHCPDSLATCETAVLVYPGQPFGGFALSQPFADTLDPLSYAASDRGLDTLISRRQDPAAATDRATAESLDACYAAVLARRDRLPIGQ